MPPSNKIVRPLIIGTNNKPKQMEDGEWPHIGQVFIPKPILRPKRLDLSLKYSPLQVSIEPTHNNAYLRLNPRLWFFRLRRAKTKRQFDPLLAGKYTRKVMAKWVHPHNHASLGSDFQGNGFIFQYRGLTQWDLKTEWDATTIIPYQYSDINFNPLQFYKIHGMLGQINPADLPTSEDKIKVTGVPGGMRKKAKVIYGFFRIVVDDYFDLNQDVTKNIIFGPPSEIFTLRPMVINGKCEGIQITLGTGNIKRSL